MSAISTSKGCKAFILNKLRIGLDFDNTLACYDEVFSHQTKKLNYLPEDWTGDKQSVKQELLKLPNGDLAWQKLQGRVYGPAMQNAVTFSGLASFLIRAKRRGHIIFIISHKTRFGHQDETKTPLRERALEWMEAQGFFDNSKFGLNIENIFFCDSRAEKANKINDLKVDLFVDDLECVFEEKAFPKIKKILFKSEPTESFDGISCKSWSEVAHEILGNLEEEDCKALLGEIIDEEIKNFQPILSGANSKVFRFDNSIGKTLVLKIYPDKTFDKRTRLDNEIKALQSLKPYGMTPGLISCDRVKNLSVLEFVEGETPSKIGNSEICQALSFVKMLLEFSRKTSESFELASEACLCPEQIEKQIHTRLRKLQEVENPKLDVFLKDEFSHLLEETLERAKQRYGNKEHWSINLPKQKRILSPGDFGFHNSIQDQGGKLKFIDLEYFGWDEPTKLIAEFTLHPAMNLNKKCKELWLKECLSMFEETDQDLVSRLEATSPLYALRWALITLNPFLNIKKKGNSSTCPTVQNIDLDEQILKARHLCDLVNSEYFLSYA